MATSNNPDDVELKVAQSGIASKLADVTETQWGCFQHTLVTASFLFPSLLIATWYISLAMINKTTKEISLSGTIGTAGAVKVINVIVFVVMAIVMTWVTLIRNVQIR
eukprot:852730_1